MTLQLLISLLQAKHRNNLDTLIEYVRNNCKYIPFMISFGDRPAKQEEVALWFSANNLIFGSTGYFKSKEINLQLSDYANPHFHIPNIPEIVNFAEESILPPLFMRELIAHIEKNPDNETFCWQLALGYYSKIKDMGIELPVREMEIRAQSIAIVLFPENEILVKPDFRNTPVNPNIREPVIFTPEDVRIKHVYGVHNGMKHGTSEEFYKDGTIRIRETFHEGIRTGTFKEYDTNGNLMRHFIYNLQGKPHGECRQYHKSAIADKTPVDTANRVSDHAFYKNGVLHGKCYSYAENGQMLNDNTLQEGMLEGVQLSYHLDRNQKSKLHLLETYSNGVLNGAWYKIYNSSKPRIAANYKDGRLDGMFTKYKENGAIEIWREYKDGVIVRAHFPVPEPTTLPEQM